MLPGIGCCSNFHSILPPPKREGIHVINCYDFFYGAMQTPGTKSGVVANVTEEGFNFLI